MGISMTESSGVDPALAKVTSPELVAGGVSLDDPKEAAELRAVALVEES